MAVAVEVPHDSDGRCYLLPVLSVPKLAEQPAENLLDPAAVGVEAHAQRKVGPVLSGYLWWWRRG